MPNQSRNAEKPRFSESTSSAPMSASGTSSGSALMTLRLRRDDQVREHHEPPECPAPGCPVARGRR
jgi:hypothetical protein